MEYTDMARYNITDEERIISHELERQFIKEWESIGNFLSTKQTRTEKRLLDRINNSLDDQHSNYQLPSYAADLMTVVEYVQKKGSSRASTALQERLAELMTARTQFNPEGIHGYQEVGDTAFITFDNFTIDVTKDYYTTAPTAEDTDTT